ncbi:deoxyguanosinetriphosphate triphosphohydrolase [bacterium]|nr:deoxyguanosinetriphosphate triphosphohydrolase [bacterium]
MLRNRRDLEQLEADKLAPYAIKSADSAGRLKQEEDDNSNRLAFQRDVDKIIWSKSFRRLGGKTQVKEESDRDDHDRTRMPHELEVVFIAQSIARRLGLNEDLTTAIALGHDIGHPPFGHAGEQELDRIMKEKGHKEGFEHNRHSLYTVDEIEKLNLTLEVRSGLDKHKSTYDQAGSKLTAPHLEAQVVNRADEIAYTGHDIDDGLRSEIISMEKIKETELWKIATDNVTKKYPSIKEDDPAYIQRCVGEIIGHLVEDICVNTDKALGQNDIETVEDVKNFNKELVRFGDKVKSHLDEMSKFLRDNFYQNEAIKKSNEHGQKIIRDLFETYYNDPTTLPDEHGRLIKNGKDKAIVVKDYVAGMTDKFAKEEWARLKK